jgi:transcriptional regulator with XRE-family HTH domain
VATEQHAGALALRRLRQARGWSWSDLARQLRDLARALRFERISNADLASIRRAIARWEAGQAQPGDQYQVLLGHAYARTNSGAVALGPGSDFAELLHALAHYGVDTDRITEVATLVASSATDSGMSLLAFLGAPFSSELAAVLNVPETVNEGVLDGLDEVTRRVNAQIGSVPFVRLHLAQAAVVDACRHLSGTQLPDPIRRRLQEVSSGAYTLAARLAFETHDDAAALALYDQAVTAATGLPRWHAAAIRTSQTMVIYYATGDLEAARRTVDAAVRDARASDSHLMRARAHALQAEMAARGDPPQTRHAHAALHLAWHDLDRDTSADPAPTSFGPGRLRGFEGVCGIFLGEAVTAEARLAQSVSTLTSPRETVQRAIVLSDQALATLRTALPGAPEAAAERLHACIDLTASTRGRVPAQRVRQTRLALKPWRTEAFVADLDEHIHSAFVGL